MTENEKLPVLEEALLRAMRALDTQVARSMQRMPAKQEKHGVKKWEPYAQRVERLCAFLLESLGKGEIELDSLLIMAQTCSKTLRILVEDLQPEGLGAVRRDYCRAVLEEIGRDSRIGLDELNPDLGLS